MVAQEIQHESCQSPPQTADVRMAFAHSAWRMLRAGSMAPLRRFLRDPPRHDAIQLLVPAQKAPFLRCSEG